MGPRARARGNDRCGIGQRGRFVASMGPRARARGNERYLLEVAYVYLLQWGHERALVEMERWTEASRIVFWLLWGHERALVEIKRLCELHGELSCFNGATSARSWKLSAFASSTVNCLASMGPRARARGNTAPRVSRIGARTLQWGHERALVEIGIRALHRGPAQASMGPRARARGNVSFSSKFEQKKEASMGPRARARGNKTK